MSVDDWSPQYMMKSLENLMPVASVVGPCSGQPAPPSSQLPASQPFVKGFLGSRIFHEHSDTQDILAFGWYLEVCRGCHLYDQADLSGFSRQEGEVSLPPLPTFDIKENRGPGAPGCSTGMWPSLNLNPGFPSSLCPCQPLPADRQQGVSLHWSSFSVSSSS